MKIRIAVYVAPDGKYNAGGHGNGVTGEHAEAGDLTYLLDFTDGNQNYLVWVTADVPLPVAAEVEGKVE